MPPESTQPGPLLHLDSVSASYRGLRALQGVSLSVAKGEIVAVVGANGAGKSTLLRAVAGQVATEGAIRFDGQSLARVAPHLIARAGVGLVPEGRRLFPRLSVEDNLRLGAYARRGDPKRFEPLELVFNLFPRLRERLPQRAETLSGGEQQMLAIGRALMTNPTLLILDEATEGLAPVIRAEIWRVLAALKAEGQSILLIDKNLPAVLRLADSAVVLEKGRSVWTGATSALAAAPEIRDAYLHI